MIRFYLSGNPVHDRVLKAFYDGCPEEKELVTGFEYKPSDIAVVFGIYKSKVPVSWPRGKVISQQRSKNKDVIVLETGYINRGDGENHHYAAGINGLNGRADFRNQGMPPDRLGKLWVDVKPWRRDGKHILLCGQVPWDASVDHTDHVSWLQMAVGRCLSHSDRQVRFRPHPLGQIPPLEGCEYSTGSFKEDLKDCWAVVTFNSNSAVEAAIEGIPVFAFDRGSMALPIANWKWDALESPGTPRRKQWLQDLAYCQWTLDEMREGQAWRHLLR